MSGRVLDERGSRRAAFNREFVSRAGRVGENTQTAYALALAFDLPADSLVAVAADRLALREVHRRGPDVVVTVGSGDYQFTVSRAP